MQARKGSLPIFVVLMLISRSEQQLLYKQLNADLRAENEADFSSTFDVLFCSLRCYNDPLCVVFGFHSTSKGCYLYHRYINGTQESLQSDPGMKMFVGHADSEEIANSQLIFRSSSDSSSPCLRTKEGDLSPYFVYDLHGIYTVTMLTLYNVAGDDYPERLHDVNIQLFSSNPVDHPSAPPTCCASLPGLLPSGSTNVKCQKRTTGKYVKIFIERSEFLTLCDVKIFGIPVNRGNELSSCIPEECKTIPSGVNLALRKTTTQSSEFHGSHFAVDEKRTGRPLSSDLCSHTNTDDHKPWLQVDLQATYNITGFTIFNRWDDRANKHRLSDVTVSSYQTDPEISQATPTVCKFIPGMFGQTVRTFRCDDVTTGRFVRVAKTTVILEICELEIYGVPV